MNLKDIARYVIRFISLVAWLNILGCSATTFGFSHNVVLSNSGKCTTLHYINKALCLEVDEQSDGNVITKLIIQNEVHPLIEITTYLTPAYIITSALGKYIAIVQTEEGHPIYVFYKTEALLNSQNKVSPLEVLDDINLEHFEFLQDNGDVAYALTKGTFTSCQTYEVEIIKGHPRHTKRCIVGFNLETKQVLNFELPYRCNL